MLHLFLAFDGAEGENGAGKDKEKDEHRAPSLGIRGDHNCNLQLCERRYNLSPSIAPILTSGVEVAPYYCKKTMQKKLRHPFHCHREILFGRARDRPLFARGLVSRYSNLITRLLPRRPPHPSFLPRFLKIHPPFSYPPYPSPPHMGKGWGKGEGYT